MNKVITRFAPSPTGYLHIGGVRTALFSFLYTKHFNGKFLLRIEDTDNKRLIEESLTSIKFGLTWLGLRHDDEIIMQSENNLRHHEAVQELIAHKKAYYCYCSQEELEVEREKAGPGYKYSGKCKPLVVAPENIKPVVRIDSSPYDSIEFDDMIYGPAKYNRDNLDDFVLMKSDGSATFMFANAVDDHDEGVTHIIRGNDHHTNTAKHLMIYKAFGWDEPTYGHLPLIMGEDGRKMSKRRNAVDLMDYKNNGFLPAALLNYLMLLGWHPSKEIISLKEATKEFDIKNVNNSPARFDMKKLRDINHQYLLQMDHGEIMKLVNNCYRAEFKCDLPVYSAKCIKAALSEILKRAFTINEIISESPFYFNSWNNQISDETQNIIDNSRKDVIRYIESRLELIDDRYWNKNTIEQVITDVSTRYEMKKGDIMKLFRAIFTGILNSYSIALILEILGKMETMKRINQL